MKERELLFTRLVCMTLGKSQALTKMNFLRHFLQYSTCLQLWSLKHMYRFKKLGSVMQVSAVWSKFINLNSKLTLTTQMSWWTSKQVSRKEVSKVKLESRVIPVLFRWKNRNRSLSISSERRHRFSDDEAYIHRLTYKTCWWDEVEASNVNLVKKMTSILTLVCFELKPISLNLRWMDIM